MAEQDQKDRDSSQNSENDTDYNKMIGQERQPGTTKGSGMGGDRDTTAEGGVGSGMCRVEVLRQIVIWVLSAVAPFQALA